jgi:hypothetical protein
VIAILALLLLFLALAYTGWTLEWTLGPLFQACRRSSGEWHFLLTDLIWLLLQLQIAMALSMLPFPSNAPTRARVGALLVACFPVLVFWLASLHAVSQARIQHPLRRAAVFVVLLPGAAIALFGLPLLVLAFLSAFAAVSRDSLPGELSNAAWLLAAGIAFTLALRWLACWTTSS